MKKRILVLLAVLTLMVACMVFTASADAYDWTSAFDGTKECPHCNQVISDSDWIEYSPGASITTGHYKVTESMTLTGQVSSAANQVVFWIQKDVVVTAKSNTRAFFATDAKGKMWLLGGTNSKITGTGASSASATRNGGLIRALGEVYIGGDLTIELTGPVTSGNMGGIADAVGSGTLHLKGGTINGVVNEGTGTVYGAIVVQATTATFEMTGGVINGGTAKLSPVYMYANGKANISGGTINGSTNVQDGGAIYAPTGTVTISGTAIIQNGQASRNGGNIYAKNGGNIKIEGGTVQGGQAVRGGNIYIVYDTTAGKLSISGGLVQNGVATLESGAAGMLEDLETAGGNIWVGRACSVTISGGTIKNGTAEDGTGGNLGNRGTATISGTARLEGGTALQGGNIYSYDHPDKYTAASTSDRKLYGKLTISGGTIDGGTATAGNGGAIYVNGSEYKLPANADPAIGNWVLQAGLTISGGTIQNGTATGNGGNLYFANTTAAISGANTVIEGGSAVKGGNICAENALTVSGGTIRSGTATTLGGNIYANNAAEILFTLSDGTITGGVAGEFTYDEQTKKVTSTTTIGEGGNIYADGKAKLVMTGGTVSDGKAYYGGNFRNNTNISTSSYSTISGGTVSGGEALRGGNIYSTRRMTVNGTALIENGKALHTYRQANSTTLAFGGNWMVWSNNQTLTGSATVQDGYCDHIGGNIAAGVGGNNTVIFNLSGSAVVTGGEAADTAGNIYFGDTNSVSAFYMSGGTVSDGTAPVDGSVKTNNIFVYQAPMNFTGGKIQDTEGTNDAGTALVMSGDKLTLGGNATVNEHEAPAVYLSGNSASLHVNANFTGEIWLFTWGRIIPEKDGVAYGTKVNYKEVAGTTTAASTTFTGKIYMAGSSEGDYDAGTGIVAGGENIGTTSEPKYELYFGGAVVNGGDNKAISWHLTTEDAIAAANGYTDRYVALYTANDITVAEDQVVYIHFRNKTVNVTNNGTIYGFDRNATLTAEARSAVTVTGNPCVTSVVAPNGYRYVALVNDGVTTFHRLNLAIQAVSLRSSATEGSLYYTAEIKASPVLRDKLTGIGVAVTLNDQASALADYLYTNEAYKEDGKYHGVLVKGIAGAAVTNDALARAQAPIYAKAYVIVDGVEILSGDDVSYSFEDVLNEVNEVYYSFSPAQKALYDAMLESDWFQAIGLTLVEKVTTAPVTPEPEV